MKIAWLSSFPLTLLCPELKTTKRAAKRHPVSWIVNLSGAIARHMDVELHIVALSPFVYRDQVLNKHNINFHIVKSGCPFTNRGFPPYLPFDVLTRFYFERKRLIKELAKIEPDIVHSHGTEGPYALTGVESKYPCIVSIQGIINEYFKVVPSLRFRLVRHFEKSVVENNNYFACRTHFDSNFVLSHNRTAKVFTLHEAMSPIYFQNDWKVQGLQTILFVGYLCERKGIEDVLKATSIVKKKHPDILLNVIGAGKSKYLTYLKKLRAHLTLDRNVKFLGFKTHNEIAQYHMDSEILVLPSKMDNSPNVIAEAMVSGLPVIATNVGGIPSMVKDQETGLLVDPNDSQGLAEKIIYLLSNPRERQRLSLNARRNARKRHNPQTVAETTIVAYSEILGRYT